MSQKLSSAAVVNGALRVKRKYFAPSGSKLFPLREALILKRYAIDPIEYSNRMQHPISLLILLHLDKKNFLMMKLQYIFEFHPMTL